MSFNVENEVYQIVSDLILFQTIEENSISVLDENNLSCYSTKSINSLVENRNKSESRQSVKSILKTPVSENSKNKTENNLTSQSKKSIDSVINKPLSRQSVASNITLKSKDNILVDDSNDKTEVILSSQLNDSVNENVNKPVSNRQTISSIKTILKSLDSVSNVDEESSKNETENLATDQLTASTNSLIDNIIQPVSRQSLVSIKSDLKSPILDNGSKNDLTFQIVESIDPEFQTVIIRPKSRQSISSVITLKSPVPDNNLLENSKDKPIKIEKTDNEQTNTFLTDLILLSDSEKFEKFLIGVNHFEFPSDSQDIAKNNADSGSGCQVDNEKENDSTIETSLVTKAEESEA